MRKCTIIGSVVALCCVFAVNGPARASNAPVVIHRGGVVLTRGHFRPIEPGGVTVNARAPRTNGISYHGGPVLLQPQNLYFIFYGGVSPTAQGILTSFASNLGGSPYWNINTTYYNGSGTHISNALHFVKAVTDSGSQGLSFDDTGVTKIVTSAIGPGANQLPKDPNGIYLVLTAPGIVDTTGLYTQYCGWHTSDIIQNADIKYGIVGLPGGTADLNACAWNETTSPNGDLGADAAASIIAHEAEETTTDPDLNAWWDRYGNENGDKCAWTFGPTQTSNGAISNMTLGGKRYLIQRNWVNANGGYCAVKYP